MSDPFDELALPPDATPGEVKARWRELRTLLHPDHGGDPSLFCKARDAYEKAYAIASRCPTCSGRGKATVARGFSQLVVRCPTCLGSGRRG